VLIFRIYFITSSYEIYILTLYLNGKNCGRIEGVKIKKDKFKVFDMTCVSCELRVERAVKGLNGVKNALASFKDESVIVEYDPDLCSLENIKDAVRASGYSTESSNRYKIAGIFVIAAAIILIGNSSSGIDIGSRLNGATYFVLFLVGMLTSIHCVGMCGGIALSQSINKGGKNKIDSIKPAVLYNTGRVISYTVLGGIVGGLGSVFSLSIPVKAGLQIFAGIFMMIMGFNMSGYSLFRKFNIRLPWSACSMKKKPRTPFLVGILNGLMPCGPLQTMQLYALGTGSILKGSLSMFIFSLGTIPLMLGFGAVSGMLSRGYTRTLLKFSGILVIVLGIVMGSRGLALAGVNIPTVSTLAAGLSGNKTSAESSAGKSTLKDGVQIIKMTADNSGYTPNGLYVQKNVPVKWIIDGKALNSCNGQIIVPSLNIQRTLQPGENVIEFTPKDGDINFSCGMGMIRGVIKVVDDISTVDTSKPDSSIPAPSSGMPGCSMHGSQGGDSTAKAPSIYGTDLSKVETNRLVKKAEISESGNEQVASIKGVGYEFEPLIVVAEKNVGTILSLDLSNFDSPEGNFIISSLDTGKSVASFQGKKEIVEVHVSFDSNDIYTI
jgi:sulfite exporter TauE/SafE/plastocyanin domain-containing protein/copper chaperone CopZ